MIYNQSAWLVVFQKRLPLLLLVCVAALSTLSSEILSALLLPQLLPFVAVVMDRSAIVVRVAGLLQKKLTVFRLPAIAIAMSWLWCLVKAVGLGGFLVTGTGVAICYLL